MSVPIPGANVLIYEPEAIPADLRIAMDVLQQLKRKVNEPFRAVLADLAEKGLVPRGDIEDVLQTPAPLEHPFVQRRLEDVPVQNRFYVNSDIYYESGLIPGSAAALRQVCDRLAGAPLPVAFLNASGATADYERLSGGLLVGEFPAVLSSMWIVAESPYAPVPEVLREMIEERKVRRKGHTTVTDASVFGGACTVILTTKPGRREAAAEEVAEAIYRRLSYLRGARAL